MLFLSIPKPCHEDWNAMSPHKQGAFCSVCAKTVIDFTILSDDEVKNYFFQNREQKTCGRFRNDQLAEPRTLPELLSRPIPFWKKFLAIVLILFGTFLSGCHKNDQNKLNKQESVMPEADQNNYATIGITLTDIIPDTSFIEERCTTVGTPAIVTDGMIEPPPMEVDGIMPIQIIEEPEIKPDTIFFTGRIKVDSIKKINPVLSKVDSVKKIIPPNDCDTLPIRIIEP